MINSSMIQMSGGDLTMSFDQEKIYFKANCLAHDVPKMLRVLSDCALEDRSPIAINVFSHHSLGG